MAAGTQVHFLPFHLKGKLCDYESEVPLNGIPMPAPPSPTKDEGTPHIKSPIKNLDSSVQIPCTSPRVSSPGFLGCHTPGTRTAEDSGSES